MTPKELKGKLGEYSGLLLYPTNKEQEAAKLPYTKNTFKHYSFKETKVTQARIDAVKDNIDYHIKELKALKNTL